MPRIQCSKIPSIYPCKDDQNPFVRFIFDNGEVGFYLRVIKEGILRKELPICHKRKGKFSLEMLHELYKSPNDNVNEM